MIEPGSGIVYTDDEGATWWLSDKPGAKPDLLADSGSLCGAGIFETGPDDPLRPACEFHDHCYNNRAWYEYMGITFGQINLIFYRMMRDIAGDALELQARALAYYAVVAGAIGAHYWNGHESWDGVTVPPIPNRDDPKL